MENFFPETVTLIGCESCKGVGTNPVMLHNEGCEAVKAWHQWFADHPDRSIDEENPVKVPLWEQDYARAEVPADVVVKGGGS